MIKVHFKIHLHFDRLIFRTAPGITESDYPQNRGLPCRQPLHKETLPAKAGRVLNNHLIASNLLFKINLSIPGCFCDYMCGRGIFRTHLSINSQRNK